MKARLSWAENSYQVDDNGKAVKINGQTVPSKMMTPEQVQQYKEIVTSVTGKPWDSDDWEVTSEQWIIIGEKVNGTYGDETRREGKTSKECPPPFTPFLPVCRSNLQTSSFTPATVLVFLTASARTRLISADFAHNYRLLRFWF